MSYQAFRPDLLTAIVHPVGCQAITILFPREALEANLNRRGIQGPMRRQILETWDALHTTGRVHDALGGVGPQPAEAAPPPDAALEGPIDAAEAGRRIGVGAARFRQIARANGLEPVDTASGRRYWDPAEVAELALSRALDKSRVPGQSAPSDEEKAA